MKKPVLFLLLTAILSEPSFAQEKTSASDLAKRGIPALNQEQLVELIVGNTLRHSKLQGAQKLDMIYKDSGHRIFYSGGPNIGMRFEGGYKIKDGKRCEQSSGSGNEVCFTVYQFEVDKYYLCDAKGACDWTLTTLKGNPLGIE